MNRSCQAVIGVHMVFSWAFFLGSCCLCHPPACFTGDRWLYRARRWSLHVSNRKIADASTVGRLPYLMTLRILPLYLFGWACSACFLLQTFFFRSSCLLALHLSRFSFPLVLPLFSFRFVGFVQAYTQIRSLSLLPRAFGP